jgi:hypothetical protein
MRRKQWIVCSPQNPEDVDGGNPASSVIWGSSEIGFLGGDTHEKLAI